MTLLIHCILRRWLSFLPCPRLLANSTTSPPFAVHQITLHGNKAINAWKIAKVCNEHMRYQESSVAMFRHQVYSTLTLVSLLNWRRASSRSKKRALGIIFGDNSFTNSTYLPFCDSLAISSLQSRREKLSINFFHKILEPSSCLHYSILNKRCNSQLLKKLWNHLLYSPPFTRTNKFKSSFLVHALYHYV